MFYFILIFSISICIATVLWSRLPRTIAGYNSSQRLSSSMSHDDFLLLVFTTSDTTSFSPFWLACRMLGLENAAASLKTTSTALRVFVSRASRDLMDRTEDYLNAYKEINNLLYAKFEMSLADLITFGCPCLSKTVVVSPNDIVETRIYMVQFKGKEISLDIIDRRKYD